MYDEGFAVMCGYINCTATFMPQGTCIASGNCSKLLQCNFPSLWKYQFFSKRHLTILSSRHTHNVATTYLQFTYTVEVFLPCRHSCISLWKLLLQCFTRHLKSHRSFLQALLNAPFTSTSCDITNCIVTPLWM